MEAAGSRQQNRVYLFVNTKSGGGQGKQYLSISKKILTYKFQNSPVTHVELIDMFDSKLRKNALMTISKKLQNNRPQPQLKETIRIIICGGDGTIMWVLQECLDNGINMERVIFGILPIGTGNDFARSLGWGSQGIKFSNSNLQQLNNTVKKWVTAKVSTYDIWDVELKTFPNGCFYDIKDQQQIKKQFKTMKKSFSNYCGMGLDARVVYTVQQNRTKYAFLNKVVYGCIGFCNFFRSMRRFQETVQEFSESESQTQSQNQNQQSLNPINKMKSQNSEYYKVDYNSPIKAINDKQSDKYIDFSPPKNKKQKVSPGKNLKHEPKRLAKHQIFVKDQQNLLEQQNQLQLNLINKKNETIRQVLAQSTQNNKNNQKVFQLQQQNEKQSNFRFKPIKNVSKPIQMKRGYRGIVALNCPSYMAGLRHVWQTKKVGRIQLKGQPSQVFINQKYNDGLLEFVGFKSQLNLALQRVMRSGARMTQGEGPFEILMKEPTARNPFYQSFIQIDGQSVKVVNLKSILITKSIKFPNSRIKVMVNEQ